MATLSDAAFTAGYFQLPCSIRPSHHRRSSSKGNTRLAERRRYSSRSALRGARIIEEKA